MTKTFKTMLAITMFTLLIVSMGLQLKDQPQGIVKLEGYGEAVAFCDGGMDQKKHSIIGGVQWKEDGIRYVVNNTHENDAEVEDLITLAVTSCAHLWY